jgi:DNA-binding NarL/FixJ family response regulator
LDESRCDIETIRSRIVEVRIVIADDQPLMRTGLAKVLESDARIRLVGQAADGRQAVELAGLHRPDVVLMDIRMPVLDGLEATRSIVALGVGARVLILTTYDLDECVFSALRAGASGFILKDRPPEELLDAIGVVAAGEALLSPSVTRRLVEEFARRPGAEAAPPQLDELTARELEILRLVAGGRSNREVAAQLVVSEATVKSHFSRVLAKLGLRDRVQAVVFAYEHGVVMPGDIAADDRRSGDRP